MTESYINIWGVLVIHVLAHINAILAFLGPSTKCMGQRLYLHVGPKKPAHELVIVGLRSTMYVLASSSHRKVDSIKCTGFIARSIQSSCAPCTTCVQRTTYNNIYTSQHYHYHTGPESPS